MPRTGTVNRYRQTGCRSGRLILVRSPPPSDRATPPSSPSSSVVLPNTTTRASVSGRILAHRQVDRHDPRIALHNMIRGNAAAGDQQVNHAFWRQRDVFQGEPAYPITRRRPATRSHKAPARHSRAMASRAEDPYWNLMFPSAACSAASGLGPSHYLRATGPPCPETLN